MNLGDELRSVLNQEAEMQSTTPPDVDRLIVGGRGRRRQRNLTGAVGAGLAVVLVGGGAYVLTQDSSESGGARVANQQTATPETSAPGAVPTLPPDRSQGLRPGTFRILVGSDEVGAPIAADLTLGGPGWDSGNFPIVEDGESFGGVAVYQPLALAAASGCDDDLVNGNVEGSPLSLARQLATLPGVKVLQPAEPSELLGRYAVHVQVTIPPTCPVTTYYRVAETPRGGRGVTYDRPDQTEPPVVMDFWVMELEGKPLVVDTWHQQGASADLMRRLAETRDSITLVTQQ